MSAELHDVLRRLAEGDDGAIDDLYSLIYDDLRRVARGQLARERPDHTLGTTALVHESYLRLAGTQRIDVDDRAHFLSIAARAMRRVLIDHARRKNAGKRGGDAVPVPLPPSLSVAAERATDLIALDRALNRLEQLHPRQSRVVECRVFAGMTVEETARTLSVSVATVKRDWTLARAWLNRRLRS